MIRSTLLVLSLLAPALVLADDARVIPAEDAAACRLLAKQECKTNEDKGLAHCQQWHQHQARKQNADAVVLADADTFIRKRPSLNGVKTVTTTIVPAAYYYCGFEPLTRRKGEGKEAVAPVSGTEHHNRFEQRLLTLQKLKDKGLISAEEYAQKRQQILDEL
jgi:hypothetical protein